MYAAALAGNSNKVKELLENGASVDSISHDAKTPLLIAGEKKEFCGVFSQFLLIYFSA